MGHNMKEVGKKEHSHKIPCAVEEALPSFLEVLLT
jgi:hypothetical protein